MSKNEAETIILCGALADPELTKRAIDRGLEPRDFRDKDASQIWSYFQSADAEGETLDAESLFLISKRDGMTAAAEYYSKIAERWPGSRDLFMRTLEGVLFDAKRRRALSIASKANEELLNASTEEDITKASAQMRKAADAAMEIRRQPIQTSSQVAGGLQEKFSKPVRRLQTGIQKLDNVLGGGLDLGRVISIIGKYKIGKTTLLSTIGYNVAYGEGEKDPDNKAKVLFITLERNQSDVESLNMCRALNINLEDLERVYEDRKKEIDDYIADPARDQIYYYHRAGANLDEISSVIMRAVRNYGVELVLIDYYQIISRPKGVSLLDHLMNVDQTVIRLADDLGIAIIIAAQSDAEGKPRDSKSLLHSAAANFAIRRTEDSPEAWLENMACNYRRQRDAGGPHAPSLVLFDKAGPHFKSQ